MPKNKSTLTKTEKKMVYRVEMTLVDDCPEDPLTNLQLKKHICENIDLDCYILKNLKIRRVKACARK